MLQVIDDSVGNTLAAASTLTADIRSNLNGGGGGNKVRDLPLSFSPLYTAVSWLLNDACQR